MDALAPASPFTPAIQQAQGQANVIADRITQFADQNSDYQEIKQLCHQLIDCIDQGCPYPVSANGMAFGKALSRLRGSVEGLELCAKFERCR